MPVNGQIAFDYDAAGAIERHAERSRQRRCFHACGPQHRARGNGLFGDADFVIGHGTDHRSRDDLDAQADELTSRFIG